MLFYLIALLIQVEEVNVNREMCRQDCWQNVFVCRQYGIIIVIICGRIPSINEQILDRGSWLKGSGRRDIGSIERLGCIIALPHQPQALAWSNIYFGLLNGKYGWTWTWTWTCQGLRAPRRRSFVCALRGHCVNN